MCVRACYPLDGIDIYCGSFSSFSFLCVCGGKSSLCALVTYLTYQSRVALRGIPQSRLYPTKLLECCCLARLHYYLQRSGRFTGTKQQTVETRLHTHTHTHAVRASIYMYPPYLLLFISPVRYFPFFFSLLCTTWLTQWWIDFLEVKTAVSAGFSHFHCFPLSLSTVTNK